jgi:uncharacterized protein
MKNPIRPIAAFLAIAFGLSWLVALPLWFGDGLESPLLPIIAIAMMTTPAIAAITVAHAVERSARKGHALGLRPIGPAKRFIGYLALGISVPIALIAIALVVGAALGLYQPDLVSFSGFQELIDAQLSATGAGPIPIPIGALVALQCVSIVLGGLINTIPALGEELGWRGWLLPRLMPLGTVPALLISGVIWGVWHAPLVLLGYNYPGVPGWLGVLAMCGMCVVVGGIFGWLRIASGSVWPAALAHGTFNAAAGMSLLFSTAGVTTDATQATILGWSGWIVPFLVVSALIATGQFRRRNQPAVPTVPTEPTEPSVAATATS